MCERSQPAATRTYTIKFFSPKQENHPTIDRDSLLLIKRNPYAAIRCTTAATSTPSDVPSSPASSYPRPKIEFLDASDRMYVDENGVEWKWNSLAGLVAYYRKKFERMQTLRV